MLSPFTALLLIALWGMPWSGAAPGPMSPSPVATALVNAGFECAQGMTPQPGIDGLVPDGWQAVVLAGRPTLNSTRIQFTGRCDGDGFVERIEGDDSLAMLSQDIETPPEPGKPFDAVVYQQMPAIPGTAYSVSGWMVSLCGGSATPSDCPADAYIAKLLGIDPAGGVDPAAATVVWVEDRRNFTESRWANLRLAATAQGDRITVFARIRSPFRWHGAHAFVDALSAVRAPTAHLVALPATVEGAELEVRWDGEQSPDIAAIPGGTYQLLFDVQTRPVGQAEWRDWQVGVPVGAARLTVDPCTPVQAVELRVRARAEQPPGSGGAWPNHRYPGDWSTPGRVTFANTAGCPLQKVLPLVLRSAAATAPRREALARPERFQVGGR